MFLVLERKVKNGRRYKKENQSNRRFYDTLEEKSNNSIKDINNFKRELKREGLYSEELEEFIEQYMTYYNKQRKQRKKDERYI